eukprot:GEMP01014438.1.p1 GENE.GEMP01014438.1~~GEMP01014438.1.p1  ORF type:complete len:392 (+),score=52.22 GEMP01014438.1:504-1679(+)
MVNPDMLNYASFATIVLQRLSVIVADVTLFLGVHALGIRSTWAHAFIMLNPALLIVDHIHFQYNGFILGLLLLAIACADERPHLSCALFALVVNAKHIFLYAAPAFIIYFLRQHCHTGRIIGLTVKDMTRIISFAVVLVSVTFLLWLPILQTGQGLDALRRMFPFGRGLTHAYWAPNIWALYSFGDRILVKLMGVATPESSPTKGLVEITPMSVLIDVKPWFTFLLIVAGNVILFLRILRKKSHLLLHVAQACAVGFACGWHVHEKAILMVIIPLSAYCHLPARSAHSASKWERRVYMILACYGTFTCMPLLPSQLLETILKWLLFSFHFLEAESFGLAMPSVVHLIPLLGTYTEFHRFGPLRAMEFLPLMIISVASACVILFHFFLLCRL